MNNFLKKQIKNIKSGKDKIWDEIKNKRKKLGQVLAVTSICVFAGAIAVAQNFTVAVAVSYDDKEVGLVQTESSVQAAKKIITDKVVTKKKASDKQVNIEPKTSIVLAKKEDVISEQELADNLVETSNEVVKGEGLYINGDLCAIVDNESNIDTALSNILDEHKTGKTNEQVEFAENVEVVEGIYFSDEVIDEKQLEQKVKDENLVTVEKSFQERKFEEIPFETEIVESDEYLEGTQIVTESGETGIVEYKEKVVTVDETEKQRQLVRQSVLREPIKQKIIVGTAKPDDESAYLADKKGDKFSLPLKDSYVSSPFGYRDGGFHKGADLCIKGGTLGKEVTSTAYGVVEQVIPSSKSGGYGLMVVIDHGNNVKSAYAHLNSIDVKEGQEVKNGERIGSAGNTGNSSGAHLHFELRINGEHVNPMDYIK